MIYPGKEKCACMVATAMAILMVMPMSASISPMGDDAPDLRGIGQVRWNALTLELPASDTPFLDRGLGIVQFEGPILSDWVCQLESCGIDFLQYVPHYSFLVNSPGKISLSGFPFVRNAIDYSPEMKLASIQGDEVMVTFLDSANALDTFSQISAKGSVHSWENTGQTSVVRMNCASPTELSRIDNVIQVSQAYLPQDQLQHSETECEIIGGGWAPETPYGGPGSMVNLAGWNGTGVMISLCDGGIGDGIPGSGHEDFGPRFVGGIQYQSGTGVYYPAGNIAGDGNSHGTHCCGCFGADGSRGTGLTYPNSGYYVGMGSAPDCTIFDQRIFSGSWGGPDTIAQWQGLFQDSYDNDVEICSFSWGTSNTEGDYDYQCVAFDAAIRDCSVSTPGDQPLCIFKSAGNDGTKGITSPGCAKNICLIGGTQNYYPDGTSYGCPQNVANIEGVASFSSRGPTGDNRIKPDVMAPAEYTLSTRTSADNDDGAGLYTPDTLDRYNWNSGTSFSGPYGAGCGGCVFEWYNDTYEAEPSAAMVRACLINCAVDVSGSSGGLGDIPNYEEGWGRIYLPNILMPSVNVMLEDAQNPLETGQTYSVPTQIVYDDPSEPLKITLAWVDPAAAEAAPIQLINNLNLKVTAPDGSTTYYGNAFSGGFSQAGLASPWDYEGTANFDSRNNVECVYIAPGDLQSGLYTVEIIAENVPVDAISSTPETDQDFALVMYNALPGVLPDEPQFDGLTDVKNTGTGNSLELQWLAGLDYDDEYPLTYNIFRDTSPGLPGRINLGIDTPHATYTPGGMNPDDPISWEDTISLTEGQTYYYWVVAQDAGGTAPNTAQLFENPANSIELSGTPESLLFFQVQSPAAGFRNLNTDPFEASIETGTTGIMTAVGDYQIDAASGKWLSDAFPSDSDLSGTWKFSVYGKMNNDHANGYLYAKVYRESDSSILFTTGYDDQDFFGIIDYSRFEWEYTVSPGTMNVPSGDRYYVELWAHVTNTEAYSQNAVEYDFTTGAGTDRWYYDTAWTSNPPSGYNAQAFETVLPSTSGAYSDIQAADGTATAGIDADGSNNRWAASKIVTIIAESPSTISSIEMRFQGAGEGVGQIDSIKQIYAWNAAASSWLFIDEGTLPRWDSVGVLLGTLDSDTSGFTSWDDYIDGSNRFTWLLFDTFPDPGNRQTRMHCDYVVTTVTSLEMVTPDGQFTFAYDFQDTPSAVHQPGEAAPQSYYDIPVQSGWNLISTPLIPSNSAMPGALEDLDGDTIWTIARSWDINDTQDPWKLYSSSIPSGLCDLESVGNQEGIWLYIEPGNLGDGIINVSGVQPAATLINLEVGWNLVGYPSSSIQSADLALVGVNADMISEYDAMEPCLVRDETDLSTITMSPGNAYWIHCTAASIWQVDW